jgi:hypothetical protein
MNFLFILFVLTTNPSASANESVEVTSSGYKFPSRCESIPSDKYTLGAPGLSMDTEFSLRELCFLDQAKKSGNLARCRKIKEGWLIQEDCLAYMAIRRRDFRICLSGFKHMANPEKDDRLKQHRRGCLGTYIVSVPDLNACKAMNDKGVMDRDCERSVRAATKK